jgi:hypothetical protein
MPIARLKPNERYAFIGKTRSGKTALAMVLAGTFARTLARPWQVWWIDTKNDPNDLAALRKWGFRNAASNADRQPERGGLTNAIYFIIRETTDGPSTVDQVQSLCEEAYKRGHVILVIDEYVQAVPSARSAGTALLNVFQRGGGKNVGLIGLTQEPVYVPRQLISQATHVCLLTLTYTHDIKYAKNLCPIYQPPIKIGDPYGFFWAWVDGSGEWDYYKNQAVWFNTVMASKPTALPEGVPTK